MLPDVSADNGSASVVETKALRPYVRPFLVAPLPRLRTAGAVMRRLRRRSGHSSVGSVSTTTCSKDKRFSEAWPQSRCLVADTSSPRWPLAASRYVRQPCSRPDRFRCSICPGRPYVTANRSLIRHVASQSGAQYRSIVRVLNDGECELPTTTSATTRHLTAPARFTDRQQVTFAVSGLRSCDHPPMADRRDDE